MLKEHKKEPVFAAQDNSGFLPIHPLFDFRSRLVCKKSFVYGFLTAAYMLLGLIGAFNLDPYYLAGAAFAAVMGKMAHTKIRLA